ncbi:sugar O-acetyltransferase [Opacimonas viscosa]|uniref:Sugar O-acetyltransferase n=1 Tax=Opacimonas viscosa TaxID=2961944 RepID=A0AA42BLW0_9ALTE|nr:sugar O-acetyltransferase [Opacimonas viscosa]MCP3429293.1 sugar O-acetyltransferase [Opacimonas viscosa]
MTEKEKMRQGLPYFASDKTLVSERMQARKVLHELAAIPEQSIKQRAALLRTFFGSTGKRLFIENTFRCDYGYNIHVGENFYANFSCTILDCAEVRIGNDCLLAPNVSLYTANHPLDPNERRSGLESAAPIHIGDDCWIGGGAIILPGVTLGSNIVVGAGAVVTKSFGDNVVIAGNPAKVIRYL